jgi:mitochondrial fission protein ELM1
MGLKLVPKIAQNEVLVLIDNRPGTSAQAIGLAEEIGLSYKTIKLDYGIFSSLPNFFLSDSLLRLTEKTREEISSLESLPSLVISAGRRAAPVALYLKKISKNQIKIAQIMNPNLDFKKFTWVILPKHDDVEERKFPNLITTIGSLTRVDSKRLESESKKFPELQKIAKTKIALLVGGSSNKTKFGVESAKKLAEISSNLAKKMNATLLVLNSRRTSAELNEALKTSLSSQENLDFQFFDWSEVKDKNPYFAILACADFFVISGDSVSMISECCSTGKSVYIFDEAEISSAKHRRFHRDLLEQNYARKLLESFENFSEKKLNETKRVANRIVASMRDNSVVG